MKLIERFKTGRDRATPSRSTSTPEHIHIDANGELVIDLREPAFLIGTPPSTDMSCPQCGGPLRIDSVDGIAKQAAMRCNECGLHFNHSLRAPIA